LLASQKSQMNDRHEKSEHLRKNAEEIFLFFQKYLD
tara:strand:- start:2293 stop:2400 length:108 start_codon:yes stop_codon:yes gene_type:complete